MKVEPMLCRCYVNAANLVGPLQQLYLGAREKSQDADLPGRTFRNPNSLLVRNCVIIPISALDMVDLWRESVYLKQHVIIAKFTIEPFSVDCNEHWVRKIENIINARVAMHRDVGNGFHFFKLDLLELIHQVLDLTPCHLLVGMVIFQC